MKLKKLLASILALAMVLSTMSTVAFAADEAKSYEVGEDKAFKNLNDALAKATEDAATNVEYHIYGAVNLEIPATHGDFDFNNATVVGKDSDAKVTVVGGGVSEITYVNMKDLTFADEGTYNSSSSEFMYQNFSGTSTFTNVKFLDGVRFCNSYKGTKAVVTVTECSFYEDSENEYPLWIDSGKITINKVTIKGTRGVKIGDDRYTAGNVELKIVDCEFVDVYKKPAFVISNVDSESTVEIADATLTNCSYGLLVNEVADYEGVTVDGESPAYVASDEDGVFYTDMAYALKEAGNADNLTKYVATVNGVGYTDIQKVLDAVKTTTDNEITLLANVSVSGQYALGALTGDALDLNDNTLTVGTSDTYFGDGTTTFTNGDIVVTGYASDSYFCGYTAGAVIVFDDVTITGDNYTTGCALFNANQGKIELINSEITVSGDTTGGVIYGGDTTIEGTTINATNVCRGITNSVTEIKENSNFVFDGGERGFNNSTVTVDASTVTIKNATKSAVRLNNNTLTLQNGATLTATDCAADIVADNEDSEAAVNVDNTSTLDADSDIALAVAKIGDTYYTSFEDALAVESEEEIELLVEQFIIDNINKDVVYDLKGKTVKGAFKVTEASTVVFENGKIINENPDVNAIESVGNVTLTDLEVSSARGCVRIENGVAVINSGNYYVPGTAEKTTNVVNVGENGNVATVIINGGTFTGPKGKISDGGAAVTVKAGSTVIINDGDFSGGKNNTLSSKGTLIVLGGTFDQDPSTYVGDGYNVANAEGVYTVEENVASEVKVVLDQVTESTYNIVLESADGKNINEFVAAELKFNNNSTTANGSKMTYEISGYTDATGTVKTVVVQADEKADTYGLRIKDENARITDKKITIGQVTFNGQGTIDFNAVSGRVVATKTGYNVEKYYVADTDAATEDTLILDEAAIGVDTIKERDVIVNIDYKHILDGTGWYGKNQITVTLKDSFGEYVDAISSNDKQFKFADVKEGRIVVTLEAPGFRKYVYTTMLKDVEDENDALVLNFWNNVKRNKVSSNGVIIDPEVEIEAGVSGIKAHNFLVGDIVMDMIVDEYDLAAVTSYYGMYGLTDTSKIGYDLNRDGNIDIIDVAYVLHTMGN